MADEKDDAPFPYTYPAREFEHRRHDPSGYESYPSFRPWLRDEFAFRCVYCLDRERWSKDGDARFSVEHLIARVKDQEKTLDYSNSFYACNRCNSWKSDSPIDIDPGSSVICDHISISDDGGVVARSDTGEYLVRLLGLDDPLATNFRRRILELYSERHSELPQVRERLREWFGFPTDLPDLSTLRPPGGNDRPAGVAESFFAQRQRGELPNYY